MGYLNLYSFTKDQRFLSKAKMLVEPLLKMASPRTSGLGWGMKHEWMTIAGLIPGDTACNTQTAYPFEFFEQLFEATRQQEYLDYLNQIAKHVSNDFHEWHDGERLACSYSTIDSRKVVNANSYRMVMLLGAGIRFKNSDYLQKGMATLRYVLSMQAPDGSWPYAEAEPFVDTYHTCFVLKNLHKVKPACGPLTSMVDEALNRGLRFYFDRLFDNLGYPVPFAVKYRTVPYKYDSYDIAESIGLLADLGIEQERLLHLLHFARMRFQTSEGWFVFRRHDYWPFNGIPYMRHANSAMLLALTKVLHLINTSM
jgi:hypothetical protein